MVQKGKRQGYSMGMVKNERVLFADFKLYFKHQEVFKEHGIFNLKLHTIIPKEVIRVEADFNDNLGLLRK